jgi:hypothetical protein
MLKLQVEGVVGGWCGAGWLVAGVVLVGWWLVWCWLVGGWCGAGWLVAFYLQRDVGLVGSVNGSSLQLLVVSVGE